METLTIKNLGFQATTYEKWGHIDYNDFKNDMLLEAFENLDDNEIISLYNDYLREENPDDEYYYFDDDFLNTYFDSPEKAVRATYFGNFNYRKEYVKFNGYGNLDSYDDFEIVEKANHDSDFLSWLFNNNWNDDLQETIDYLNDNEEEIKEEAMKLVRKGY